MLTEKELEKVHKIANDRLYSQYPCLDMANLQTYPEGHWKLWEIRFILEAYNEVKKCS